jgi:hypothetical protein
MLFSFRDGESIQRHKRLTQAQPLPLAAYLHAHFDEEQKAMIRKLKSGEYRLYSQAGTYQTVQRYGAGDVIVPGLLPDCRIPADFPDCESNRTLA